MYHIWDHTFESALRIDPAQGENKIMLTNPPLNPTQNRMKLMETMFERYGFSALSIQVQAGLTLYAQGNASCHTKPCAAPLILAMLAAILNCVKNTSSASFLFTHALV